jgi:hypothetical protein
MPDCGSGEGQVLETILKTLNLLANWKDEERRERRWKGTMNISTNTNTNTSILMNVRTITITRTMIRSLMTIPTTSPGRRV